MADAAGNVNVVLSMNAVTFTQGIKNAQNELDKFSGKAKQAGHSTVSSMQASSAAIREMNGNFTQNTRAVERFITTIPGVGKALQFAFPLIGGAAFIGMLAKAGTELAAFIDKANKMPAAIKQGFESLHLSAMASNDALKLTNDLLQNHINKLNGKAQNNLAIQLDEARIKADDLAKSLETDSKAVKSLLDENKLGSLAGLLTGKASTSSVEGTVKYGLNEIQSLGYQNRMAAGTTGEKAAKDALDAKIAYYQSWAKSQLFLRDNPQYATDSTQDMAGDQGANRNILMGFQGVLQDQQSSQVEKNRNAKLVPESKAAEAAAEARKKAAEEFAKMLELDGEVAQKWKEYEDNNAKIFSEELLDKYKTNFLSSDANKGLSQQGKGANDYIASLRESITLNKENSDAIAEASLQMAVQTGQMTKMGAAQVLANMHTADYEKTLQDLKDQRESITSDPQYNGNELARKAALQDNTNRMNGLNGSRAIQSMQDDQDTNPAAPTAQTGFYDAINGFVEASRDAATQMKDLVGSTLSGLNQQLVAAMLGQKTSFGNFGAGVFRSVASTGLQKGEGALMSMFGGGKLGTKANPMAVTIVSGSDTGSAAGGVFGKLFGKGGSSGSGSNTTASVIKDMIPFLASGGPINGPAIVGENGPELFTPGTAGTIIPNHKLNNMSSGGNTVYVDATGSTDPAQVEAAAYRAVMKAAPHIMSGGVLLGKDQRRRSPSNAR